MAATVSWDALRELAGFRAAKGVRGQPLPRPRSERGADRRRRRRPAINSLLSEGERSNGAATARPDARPEGRACARTSSASAATSTRSSSATARTASRSSLASSTTSGGRLALTEPVAGRRSRSARELYLDAARAARRARRGRARRRRRPRARRDLPPAGRPARGDRRPDRGAARPHDQGGWSQARYQRHIEELVAEHLRNGRRRARPPRAPHALAARSSSSRREEHARRVRRRLLSNEVQERDRRLDAAPRRTPAPTELLEVATPVLERGARREEERLLERWREETARNGRARLGLGGDARGRLRRPRRLPARPGAAPTATAGSCPQCGRVAAEAGACPLDGTADGGDATTGLDLAVHQTLAHGGDDLDRAAPPGPRAGRRDRRAAPLLNALTPPGPRTEYDLDARDGRTLRVAEYGDQDGYPILFSHGTPGSRLDRHPDPGDLRGYRLVPTTGPATAARRGGPNGTWLRRRRTSPRSPTSSGSTASRSSASPAAGLTRSGSARCSATAWSGSRCAAARRRWTTPSSTRSRGSPRSTSAR